MRLSSEFRFVFVLLFFCISLPNAKADINDICVNATYQCLVDDVPPNGDVIGLSIGIDYTSTTGEQIDCVTLTLPPGWTYVSGSEVGTNSDADGNYITDTGNGVTFGTAGFCPGGGSGNSSLGAANISIIISVIAPPTWTPGDCNAEGDGDIIAGITWDYAGDGTGEASPSTPGNNGGSAITFDVVDASTCTGVPDAGTVMQLDTIVCPTEPVTFDVGPITLDGCGEGYFIQFEDALGGTGGPNGPFQLVLPAPPPYTLDAGLNGALSDNGFPPLEGTWCLFGVVGNAVNQACSITDFDMCITFLPVTDPTCQALTCSGILDGFTQTCEGIIPGINCSLDDNLADSTYMPAFEFFFETDGSTTGDGIISAASGYTTGQEIFDNINSGAPGEVIFFGNPGDCSFVPFPTNSRCQPVTLDVYVVPVEYDSTGTTSMAINLTCAIETITVTIEPSQELLTIMELDGDCNTIAGALIGFDRGDGAGGPPDGDLFDPEDRICSSTGGTLPDLYPCGTGINTAGIPTMTAADVAQMFFSPSIECFTDINFTAEAICQTPACPPCDVEAPTLTLIETTCPDGSTGAPLSLDITGGTTNPGEITEYFLSSFSNGTVTNFITSTQAEGVPEGQPQGGQICINVITYVQAELDAIMAQTNVDCAFELFPALGVPTSGATFEGIYDAVVDFGFPDPTVSDFEAWVAGMNGGPGLGGTSDIDAILGNDITCPNTPPFCYELNTLCFTVPEYVTCQPCKPLDLTINFDAQPQQTTWEITDAGGAVMFSGGPYNNPADNGGTVVESVCLPDGCYDLTFFDAANDGMCPRRISTITSIGSASIGIGGVSNGIPRQGAVMCGNYNLSCPSDGTTFASGGGRFGTSEINNFCLPIVPLIHQDDNAYQLGATDDHTPQMRLLPNVAKDKMTLYYTLQTKSDIHIQIMDISGKIVQQHIRNPYDASELELTVSDLNEGFYFVQLISGDVNMVQKFIKQ